MARRGTGLPELPPPEPVRAGGVTLSVRRLVPEPGGGPAPPRLVAFHGGPGLDHHVLLPLGLLLAERYEVWLPDLPGHGASPAASGATDLTLRRLLDRLGRWLAGIEPGAALLGHSLGAWLLRELLAGSTTRNAPRPPAAVLVSPPAAGQDRGGTALRRAGALLRRRRAPGRPPKAPAGTGSAGRTRREVRAHVDAETRGRAAPIFLEALDRGELRDPRRYGALQADLHHRLIGPVRRGAPPCPVLILCGEEDRTTPPEQARRVAESLEGAQLGLLPGAGHYPFADALERTAHAVRRFLDPLSAPGS